MKIYLIVFSMLAAVIGFFFLSQITLGVGLICFGCLLAILARVAQQDEHHEEIIRINKVAHNIIEK